MDSPAKGKISQSDLFLSFLRLGLTAFGGPAMVAYIRRLAVERKGWLADGTFRDGISLCQAIPGATAMQMAAYVGLKAGGVTGAAASFIGFGFPAFVFMIILANLYMRTSSLPVVAAAFTGLHALIVAIIANAAISFGRNSLKSLPKFAIAILTGASFLFGLHPIIAIVSSAVLGLLLLSDRPDGTGAVGRTNHMKTLRPAVLILLATFILFAGLFFIDRKLFNLGTLMMRIDIFAFGGGFASVPLMFHEFVEVRSWLPANTFMDGIALGQVTPGPIVITATFVGYLVQGLTGAVAATIGIFTPSFLMVIGLSSYFDQLRNSPRFVRILNGILCSFVGLLLAVTIRFALSATWSPACIILAVAALAALLLKVDILWVVLAGAVYSVIFC
jgi:chromate transporter